MLYPRKMVYVMVLLCCFVVQSSYGFVQDSLRKPANFSKPTEKILSISRQAGIYQVVIHYKNFTQREHKLYIRNDAVWKNVVWRIDGKSPSGVDGNMPSVEITSIKLLAGNKEYKFPKSQYNSLFNPHLDIGDRKFGPNGFGITEEKDRIQISLSGGDGGSAFEVRWVINKRNNKITRYLNEFPDFEKAKKSFSRLIPIKK